MATIQITVPDAQVASVRAALAAEYGVPATLAGAEYALHKYLTNLTCRHEGANAGEVARLAKYSEIESALKITAPVI